MKFPNDLRERDLSPPHECVLLGALALTLALACPTVAQCPLDWQPGEGAPGVVGDATVFASTVWDPDGAGAQNPLVVVGGTLVGAGDVPVNAIAAWNPASEAWQALGDGLNGQVRALIVHDGELIAAAGHNGFGNPGPANGVARFDVASETWQPLGAAGFQNVVWALTIYNGDLYAGGLFNSAGGTPVNNIARWNGTSWQSVGAGIPGGVTALTVFNGQLLAASNGVLRWTGTSWVPFGPNLTGNVQTFATYDGELVAGGSFQTQIGTPIDEVARWNGTAWQVLGGGMTDNVNTLVEYNGELIAGGLFTNVEGQATLRMARWDGVSWSPMPLGAGMPSRRCDSLIVHDGVLYATGGTTTPAGTIAAQAGRWDGAYWSHLGDGFDAIVYDFATYNGELIAGGWFYQAGDIVANGIARRDAAGQWHSMGGLSGGDEFIFDMVVHDGKLIVSGSFTSIGGVPAPNGIAQWDGKSWSAFGNVAVGKKLVHDGELYAPGAFGPNQHVARWNPATQTWQPLGTFPANVGITCLTIFNGDLIAGGIGGIGVNASVWRWNFDAPGTWQPVGQHIGYGLIQTLGVYNGELLMGGYNDGSGGPPGGLARFNGTSWVPLGGGLYLGNESPDKVLAVFDLRIFNGELIVAGTFSYAGAPQYTPETVAAFHVASWNGTNWSALGSGTNNAVVTLHEHEGDLLMGGWFDMAGGAPNGHWARWGSACSPGDATGDGLVNIDDLFTVIAGWGGCPDPPADCPADIDSDGDVDVDDLFTVLAHWSV